MNQMWILKNSKDLLEYIESKSLSSCNITKTFDLSTLYITIHHSKLKDRLMEMVQLCPKKKNGQRRHKYLVLGRNRSYFVKKKHSESIKKFFVFSPVTISFSLQPLRFRSIDFMEFSRYTSVLMLISDFLTTISNRCQTSNSTNQS